MYDRARPEIHRGAYKPGDIGWVDRLAQFGRLELLNRFDLISRRL
jgi:hypothetical protein